MSPSSHSQGGGAPRYIVVEGPIGAGKTALARRLAESLNGELILEEAFENPFLERFYREGRSAALPTQMFFLFSRARQMEQLRQSDMFARVRVADYLFAKDRLFAEINLDADELSLYDQIHERLRGRRAGAGPRHLPAGIRRRIDGSDRSTRRRIRAPHRQALPRATGRYAYARFFHTYDDGPLLIVNASQIDPVNNETDYQRLFERIESTTGGRHFFNPTTAEFA